MYRGLSPPNDSDYYRDNRDYITALLFSYHTTLQGGGVLLRCKFYSTRLHGGDRLRCGNHTGM